MTIQHLPCVSEIIAHFSLAEHFEGGYFAETYRSGDSLPVKTLSRPQNYPQFASGDSDRRSVSSGILFLLEDSQVSSLHKIQSDEMWHFYMGSVPLQLLTIHPESGRVSSILLGSDILHGQSVQYTVPAGHWFGGMLDLPPTSSLPTETRSTDVEMGAESDLFALVGCTVAPGFDVRDFTLGKTADLLALVQKSATENPPETNDWIKRLSKG
jgi:predicted cupin superfamily sugar epimerase